MHTYRAKHGTTFHYNLDLSGEVVVNRNMEQFLVSGADLIELIARAPWDDSDVYVVKALSQFVMGQPIPLGLTHGVYSLSNGLGTVVALCWSAEMAQQVHDALELRARLVGH